MILLDLRRRCAIASRRQMMDRANFARKKEDQVSYMKRQRGRGRKPGNTSNRNMESNGPDVKIRGNAAHIYDKYMQLARDASSSGDRVMAENYFQHAEHYLRIVQSAQAKREEQDAEEARNQPRRPDNADRRDDGAQPDTAEAGGEGEGRSRARRGRGRRRDEPAAQPTAGDDPLQVVNPEADGDGEAGEAQTDDADSNDEADAPRRGRGRRRRAEAAEDGEAEAKPRRRTRRTPDPDAEAALQNAESDGDEARSEGGAAA